MNIVVLIPSRFASTRLPGKPLIDINGKTLIHRVYDEAEKLNYPTYCCIDSEDVAKEVESFGGKYIMTDSNLPSGSDRIFQALKKIEEINDTKYDIVVDFQGDSLNIRHEIIQDLIKLLIEKKCDITTIALNMKSSDYNNPAMVKIAMDFDEKNKVGNCLYFSRSLIPFDREGCGVQIFHHVGIYVYSRNSLEKFVSSNESRLEKIEKLEQLRALSNGMNIWAKYFDEIKIHPDAPADINVPAEAELCKKYFK